MYEEISMMIEAENIIFSYASDGKRKRALRGLSFHVHRGEYAVILGHNGCGKSTLLRHLNALLPLQSGELTVAGIDASDPAEIWKLRRRVGMVFQNPDNQFVSSIVGEDVAFGLENYQVPRDEIPERVSAALRAVGMEGFEKRAPHTLSGGQKQRAALAGVLALEPKILLFDEVTPMLDPEGRAEVLGAMRRLHEDGKTVVAVTHYIEEAVQADTVWLMHDGKMLAHGSPREMLTQPELLAQTGLEPPVPVRLYYDLLNAGFELPYCPLTNKEFVEELCRSQYGTSH